MNNEKINKNMEILYSEGIIASVDYMKDTLKKIIMKNKIRNRKFKKKGKK
jgi:hypothetical protein